MIADSKVSSGGTPLEEYQRTMGAAFAVYWLLRIGIDGERGFCFGVDQQWRPNELPFGTKLPHGSFFALDPVQRRVAFYYKAPYACHRHRRRHHHRRTCLMPHASRPHTPASRPHTPASRPHTLRLMTTRA